MFVGVQSGSRSQPSYRNRFITSWPCGGVGDLGVELDRVEASFGILHRGDRDLVGAGGHAEPLGRPRDGVAVAHPHGVLGGEVLQQPSAAGVGDAEASTAVLALAGGRHLAAERPSHQLMPVADAQHGDAQLEQPGVDLRAVGLVHAGRTARQDDARGLPRSEVVGRGVVRDDLGVDVRLADPPGDQLRVLRPEVDDQDRMWLLHGPTVAVVRGSSMVAAPSPRQRDCVTLFGCVGNVPSSSAPPAERATRAASSSVAGAARRSSARVPRVVRSWGWDSPSAGRAVRTSRPRSNARVTSRSHRPARSGRS